MTARLWDRFPTGQDRKIDSLIVTGRTSARVPRIVDSFTCNDRCAPVSGAGFDCFEVAHPASMFDRGVKRADIAECREVREFLAKLGSGLFANPPSGVAKA